MFISFVIAWVLATWIFFQSPERPSLEIAWIATLIALSAMVAGAWLTKSETPSKIPFKAFVSVRKNAWIANLFLGFIIGWCGAFWQTFFHPHMDESWLGKAVYITGEVVDLTEVHHHGERIRIRFDMRLDRIRIPGETHTENNLEEVWHWNRPLVTLSWYLNADRFSRLQSFPRSGQSWTLPVKLKPNHGSLNLGALDYERWLYQQGVSARGYVLNRELDWASVSPNALPVLPDLRRWLAEKVKPVFSASPFSGLYQALSYGDRRAVTDDQWRILQKTGTVHLMAISGLHMGIVALLGYWVFKSFWWLGAYRIERFNLPMFGAVGALLFATIYLVLAGFSIPTQRAYLMVLAALLFLFIKRSFQPWSALALAAWLVTLWDPASVLSLGFWLSFLAVALIFAALQQPSIKSARNWQKLLWIQVVLTLGLAPFLVWSFHTLPLYSLPANLVAVPFVSLIGLPLVFLTLLVGLFSMPWAQTLMLGMDALWGYLWDWLAWLAGLQQTPVLGSLSLWLLVGVYGGLFSWLLARTRRFKIASGLILGGLLAFWWWYPDKPRPPPGEAQAHLLDVGQGQALVIETAQHVLVYDTGAKWGSKMDGAKLAVLPFLRARNWSEIDVVMISHSDIDHAGGLPRLLRQMPVNRLQSGQPQKIAKQLAEDASGRQWPRVEPCEAGQSWVWDGVRFEVLSPGLTSLEPFMKSDNDRSCVLRVTANGQRLLVSGDLSTQAEKRLIDFYRLQGSERILQADLLISGHHGSRYSTAVEWLNAVRPKTVLFSAGYRNRFLFPTRETVGRVNESGAVWFNTACSGGIGYRLGANRNGFDVYPEYQVRKRRRKWYHHRCLPNEKGMLYQ